MDYSRTITLDLPYAEAVPRVREAFQQQGFGILTEIDVRATLKDKIGADVEDYVILGACNPQLAYRALEIDREIGVLLPCNVVVRALPGGRTLVQALDPAVMVAVPELPQLQPVAGEAGTRIKAALETLTAG
jgi:uncharacterized protein (DUF302 family)